MAAIEVRTAKASEQDSVIDALVLAFSDDPPMRYVWPRASDYLAGFRRFAAAFGGNAFAQGTAFVAGEGAAAALWLPPGVEPDGERMGSIVENAISDAQQPDVVEVLTQMAAYHPKEPHWYLPILGVDPVRQGLGLGSALLKHALARCDADGVVAYLESSNVRNVPLYERHGFEVMGEIQPGDFPPIWPMLRPARR